MYGSREDGHVNIWQEVVLKTKTEAREGKSRLPA
jgi:hypothetical protein